MFSRWAMQELWGRVEGVNHVNTNLMVNKRSVWKIPTVRQKWVTTCEHTLSHQRTENGNQSNLRKKLGKNLLNWSIDKSQTRHHYTGPEQHRWLNPHSVSLPSIQTSHKPTLSFSHKTYRFLTPADYGLFFIIVQTLLEPSFKEIPSSTSKHQDDIWGSSWVVTTIVIFMH